LLFFKQQSEISTGDVKGYNASDLHILSQLVTIGEEPDPTQWKEFNYTSDLTGFGTWGATTIPRYALTDSNYFFNKTKYDAATTYSLTAYTTLPTPSNLSGLGFGEESVFVGNINTDIKAVVYRTQIIQILNMNDYNISTNPTFSEDDDVYISEAGIYDDNNNLVAIGKMNDPIMKNNSQLFTIELDIDF